MTNIMLINFYVRPSMVDTNYGSVYVQVTINGQRMTLGAVTSVSGLKMPKSLMIEVRHWDNRKKKVRLVSTRALEINRAISECEIKLNKIYQQHEGFDITMNAKQLKLLFFGQVRVKPTMLMVMEAFITELEDKRTKKSTVETYKYKQVPLKVFLKKNDYENLLVEEFTPDKLEAYKTFLMVHRKNSERSADKARQVVKTIILWAAGSGLIKHNPLINTRIRVDKTPNTDCLTQDQVRDLMVADLTPALRKVADCFVFCCYTGLAYQDLKGLGEGCLQTVEGRRCIVGKRNKTSTGYCIPITRVVDDLMIKYGGVHMPLPSNQQYNALLKVIAHTMDFAINLCSHTARKTFADWCMNEICLTEEATIVAMGQKDPKELTPYRKLRPKRLIAEFPNELLMSA